MKERMKELRRLLVEKYGAYGRNMLIQLCQEFGVDPLDEPTEKMWRVVYGKV